MTINAAPPVELETTTPEKTWLVYMIQASDQRLYTGITNNMAKRWHAHNHTKAAAKFFRGRRPERVLFIETEHSRSTAGSREYAIKQLSRQQKLALIHAQATDWHQRLALPDAAKK